MSETASTSKHFLEAADELTEAAEIIQYLRAYGMIHPVTGVVYPQGTHEEFIKKADEWLWRFRGNNT